MQISVVHDSDKYISHLYIVLVTVPLLCSLICFVSLFLCPLYVIVRVVVVAVD